MKDVLFPGDLVLRSALPTDEANLNYQMWKGKAQRYSCVYGFLPLDLQITGYNDQA